MLTDSIINIARIVIDCTVISSTFLSICFVFAGDLEYIYGEKSFSAYGPALAGFLLGFLVSLFWGFMIGPFDLIILAAAGLNGIYLVYFLIKAWAQSLL